MDSDEVSSDEHILEMSTEHFMCFDSSGGHTLEETSVPRIGDQYQALLPPLQQHLDSPQLIHKLNVGGNRASKVEQLNLDIPVSWIPGRASGDDLSKNKGNDQAHGFIVDKNQYPVSYNQLNTVNTQRDESIVYVPLPCLSSYTWSEYETKIFVLGLYIFGKNLVHLQKFVESRKMADILSFYYGKFYMCEAHRKWSECKKSRGRRRVLGHHLLTGWRQQELLSRLSPSISQERQKELVEATRVFNENGMSLEMYSFTLKNIVGVKALVDAVGIGKAKYDLTSMVIDPARGNQSRSIHSEVPSGKACSSLTDADVIKFLTGDYRLSKARSNDLFWEAVWPRLLARGWHSEQPKYQVFTASKRSLIFLAPGIRKFSRRKLTKGEHYFDSVTDVLNKIALEPRILEIGLEEVGSTSMEAGVHGNGYVMEQKPKPENGHAADECCNGETHPKSSCHSSRLMKFTVVDTSLVEGEAPFLVRELRSLPMDYPVTHLSSGPSEENNSSCSGVSTEKPSSDEVDNSSDNSDDQKEDNKAECKSRSEIKLAHPDSFVKVPGNFKKDDPTAVKDEQPERVDEVVKFNQSYTFSVPKRKRAASDSGISVHHPSKHEKNVITHQFTRRRKTANTNITPPISKKCVTACSSLKVGSSSDSLSGGNHIQEEGGSKSKPLDALVNLAAICQPYYNAPFTYFSNNGSSIDGETSSHLVKLSEKTSQKRDFIDLNLPQYPAELDTQGPCTMEVTVSQSYLNNAGSPSETGSLTNGFSGQEACNQSYHEQNAEMTSQRQSSRNRPLTTRVLESLETGFLGIKRKARGYRNPYSDAPRVPCPTRTNETSISASAGNSTDFEMIYAKDVGDEECMSHPKEKAFPTKSQFEMPNA